MIERDIAPRLTEAAKKWPAVTLTGPRQSGKTTLCQKLFSQLPYVMLEALDTQAFATEDPRGFLARYPHGAVLDEVQKVPNLFSYLQENIDEDPSPGKWILTGSHNFSLLESITQSLAGRTAIFQLLPLARSEINRFPQIPRSLNESLFTGTFPRLFDRKLEPSDWYSSYVATYVERDVRTLSNVSNLPVFQRFLGLCAGRTAQLLNYSSLANDCGISQPTARAWLSILEMSYLVFRLPPYHANIRKRLTKMPKLHFHDTGLVCWLLGIRTPDQLDTHPLRGQIFESWVASEMTKRQANLDQFDKLFFYRDGSGTEVDLVVQRSEQLLLLEVKSAATLASSPFENAKRIRRHLAQTADRCSLGLVYGGDQVQSRKSGKLIPWGSLHEFEWETSRYDVIVRCGDRPIVEAEVLALFPNETWKKAATDERGRAVFDLHSLQLPMTVFVAAKGYTAVPKRKWIPENGPLEVELAELPDGGAVIFSNDTGYVPILKGRLNPIRDKQNRTYLYADNLAINDGLRQPVDFQLGEELRLEDSAGQQAGVRIVSMVGRSSLIEYRSV